MSDYPQLNAYYNMREDGTIGPDPVERQNEYRDEIMRLPFENGYTTEPFESRQFGRQVTLQDLSRREMQMREHEYMLREARRQAEENARRRQAVRFLEYTFGPDLPGQMMNDNEDQE